MSTPVPNPTPAKKKAVKPQKNKKRGKGQVPVMQEVLFTISRLVVIVVGLATTGISVMSGADFWMSVMRGAGAMFSIGILLWLVCWQINHDTLEMTRVELMNALEEARNKEAEEQEKAEEANIGTLLETQV